MPLQGVYEALLSIYKNVTIQAYQLPLNSFSDFTYVIEKCAVTQDAKL